MLTAQKIASYYNPIDSLELIFDQKSADFERRNVNEVVVEVEGKWNNMLLFFAWEEHLRCLHISCLMNINVEVSDYQKFLNCSLWLMKIYGLDIFLIGANTKCRFSSIR